MKTKPEKQDKRSKGRPVTNEVEQIPAKTPGIFMALFPAADKKIIKPK